MGEKDPTVFLQQRNMLALQKQRLRTRCLHGSNYRDHAEENLVEPLGWHLT